MNEMIDTTLGEVLEIKYGKDHKKLADGNIPMYGSGGIMRYVEKAIYDKPSIMIPRKGSLNNLFYEDSPFWTVDTLFWTKINEKKVDPKYLFYLLSLFKLSKYDEGSAVPSLTTKALNDVPISYPKEKSTQIEIRKIIENIDKKITLLRQQNQTLEELAQTLFKRWFVEFEFPFDFAQGKPDENGQPYKSSGGKMEESELGEIPEGWRVGELIELIKKIVDNRGKTPPLVMEKKHLMLETYQMSEKTTFPKFDSETKKKYVSEETYNSWFRAGHPQYLDILFATVGNGIPNWCFMPKNENQFCVAQNLVAIRANKEIGGVYLKYFFDTNYFIRTCKGIIITTAQPSIKLGHLKQLEVLLPSKNLITKYNKLVFPMVNQISNNSDEIQTLTQLRDTLLPKLMSGEVRVKE